MKKIGKKAFIFGIGKLVIFVLVLILLFFLIKNSWNINDAFNSLLTLLRIK
ncbi:MAG: hypothetical protein IH934_06665 [Nanoarchaeota archaeon]|nr:hypothetical protein [Nanoarchaeota archaeon]